MLAEMIDRIVHLGKLGAQVQVVELPRNQLMLKHPSGESEVIDGDAPVLNTCVTTIASFVEWVKEHADLPLRIYVSDLHIIGRVDETEDPDYHCVSFKMEQSMQLTTLKNWASCKGYLTHHAVSILRGPLADTCADSFLTVLRRMKFSIGQTGQKQVSHKGESMGREIEQQAESYEGEIPETISFVLPLFRGLPVGHSTLRCAVSVDPANETVALDFIADTLDDAIRSVVHEMVTKLQQDVPGAIVVAGIPK